MREYIILERPSSTVFMLGSTNQKVVSVDVSRRYFGDECVYLPKRLEAVRYPEPIDSEQLADLVEIQSQEEGSKFVAEVRGLAPTRELLEAAGITGNSIHPIKEDKELMS